MKRTRIRPISLARARQRRAYTQLRAAFLAENPWCERCGRRSTEVHHRKGCNGELLLAVEFFMSACRPCHDLIGDQPIWAIAEGWSLPRNAVSE